MKRFLVLVSLTLAMSVTSAAEEASNQAVVELFKAMKMDTTFEQSINQMLEIQIQQKPELAPFRSIMRTFFEDHMSYEALEPQLIQMYEKHYTTEELKGLTEFYSSPLGQKTISTMPALMAEGAQLGMQRVQANLPELEARVREEAMRLNLFN